MGEIKILDCTLRDGGYINDWNFGKDSIKDIIGYLESAKIEYIECGFLNSNSNIFNENRSIYNNTESLIKMIKKSSSQLALMMQVNDNDVDRIPVWNEENVQLIRLSFHKEDLDSAKRDAIKLKNKGYLVFFQPTIIMNYSNDELKDLVNFCNNILMPDAFGIVDTLGEMTSKDVIEKTRYFDVNLSKKIKLLYHGHNNMQMAFSNAITFIETIKSEREVIVDTSVLGMGRDAGNVCTELMSNYLIKNYNKKYVYAEILQLINKQMFNYKKDFEWGYSPYYLLNAINRIHPKYGKFFKENINGLSLNEMDYIFSKIPLENRIFFDKTISGRVLEVYKKEKERYKYEKSCCNTNKIK